MGKNKNNRPQQQTAQRPAAPRPEPTPQQLGQIASMAKQVDELSAAHGPVSTKDVSEPAGGTLAESLKRIEDLLRNARALFDKAHSLETANKTAAEELANQQREVRTRINKIATRESDASEKEAAFAEQSARLVERELNAERGFLAEKARVLKPIEDDVMRLRDERDRLEREIAVREETARDELRKKAEARAAKWAEERLQLDDQLARERIAQLDALRVLLATEREQSEEAWRVELERRISLLDAREVALDAREHELTEKLAAFHSSTLDLAAEKEIHDENCAGLERKVERLVTERTEKLRSEAEGLKKLLDDARNDRDAYWKEIESRKELDRRFGNRQPEDILSALTTAERDRDSLAQQLRERPDAGAAERLAQLERERSAWLNEKAVLHADIAKARGELESRRQSALELETLTKQKELLEVHKQILGADVDELRTRVDELTRQEDHRNPMTALKSLDERDELQAEVRTTPPLAKATPTLREFAIDLRHRIAHGVKGRTLYYAERDVRAFLGGLAMTRLMLLQGISGTGKTSLPLAFHHAVDGDIEIVEVQAGWRDRQDLVGYYNAFHRHYYATNFLQALYRAGTPARRDRLFLMVLDEINLSRPEQFFADFLSTLEQPMHERRLTLVNDPVANAPKLMVDGRHLPIPPNVWFIGTANHDESTAEFADKTYDRAHVMEMPRVTEAAHFNVEPKEQRNPISYRELESTFDAAAEKQRAAVKKATNWLRKALFAEDLQRRFRVGWGNRLENQLARYLPIVVESGGTIGEAMDHLLVTKVLRKLKDRHDVRAAALEELRTKLELAWESLDDESLPERSVALIDDEIAAKKGEDLA